MKKNILILAIALSAVNMHYAQANHKVEQCMQVELTSGVHKVQGVVLDKHTQESLAGVAVQLGNQKTYTDLDGNFELNRTVKGSYELKASMISYQDLVLSVDLTKEESLVIAMSQP